MGQYTQAFSDNDVDGQTLGQLTERDLIELGVSSVGHRRRLATAIAQLHAAEPAQELPKEQGQPQHADYRQLSVLYCETLAAESLSSDEMRLRDAVQTFHKLCVTVVTDFDGHFANFYGDRILAYFGWPRAHEDDVERAVRAGLRMVKEGRSLGMPLRVSVGTGDVVVGDLIHKGPAAQQSAVGFTPNLAARLLGLAAEGRVVIDELTRRLLPWNFTTRALGAHSLKGVAEPVLVHEIEHERPVASRFDAHKGPEIAPMYGRDQELALLQERWAQAQHGEGTAVLVVGEPGMGKSRLVRALLDACGSQAQRVRWQCSPYHRGSALWPVIEQLARAASLENEDAADVALDKLEHTVGEGDAAAVYATLLGLNGTQRYGPLQMTPQMLRERTLGLLIEQLYEMAEQRPLMLIVEDTHWIDPTTTELIERCLERIDETRLLMLLTSRPDSEVALAAHPCVTRLSLNRLSQLNVQAMARQLAGRSLKSPTLARIVAQTDGVPLFVEELTKAMMETGESAVPASLHGSLMARLDRAPEVKEVAQVAACIGREFDLALLQAVCEQPDAVAPAIDKLMAAELVFLRGDRTQPRYTFKHALVQETAQASMLRTRRQFMHARILDVLRRENAPDNFELLAHHATEAGKLEFAADYWKQAGNVSLSKSAYFEAKGNYTRAMKILASCTDDSHRRAQELETYTRLAQVEMATQGFGSKVAAQLFQRALTVIDADRDGKLRQEVLTGLDIGHFSRAELTQATVIVEQLHAEAESTGTSAHRLTAYSASFKTRFAAGDFLGACQHCEQVLELYRTEHGRIGAADDVLVNVAVGAYCYLGWSAAILASPEEARTKLAQAYSTFQAHEGKKLPISTAAVMNHHLGLGGMILGEESIVERARGFLVELAVRHRIEYLRAYGKTFAAWIANRQGRHEEAVVAYEAGLKEIAATDTRVWVPFHLSGLATALSATGRHENAYQVIVQALAQSKETGECWCQAELWRVKGELLLARPTPDHDEASRSFDCALELARRQDAKLWQLRTAMSLAGLRACQGRRSEALAVLRGVCETLTERSATGEIAQARILMNELAALELP